MPHTILAIEDQPDIRRLIRMTLEFKGHRVIEAGDGVEGLRLAREQRPDLILLDVMMPGMDGLTVSKTLAEDPQLSHIPVVMLSALGSGENIEAGLAAGAQAYLVKPFSPLELLEKVGRLAGAATVAPARTAGSAPA